MNKLTVLLTVVFWGCSTLFSMEFTFQNYSTGIGIRAGLSNGITLKHFVKNDAALEGIISFRWRGVNITGLYEVHKQIFDVSRLNFYYGAGAHIGFWRGYKKHPWFIDDEPYTVLGIDGILGLEYNFTEVPINVSIDWKPAINIIGYYGFWGDEGALSVRYIF